ncbi:hypothetical protein G9A89_023022 [Geosiphon pyriformis]|nr:hypothetical protein G9A89_023022 [Geosiphon pyriformis]
MHDSFKKLQNFCTEITANNPTIVFNSQYFTSLSENALTSIVTRDDLNIEESEIWEKIAEWGVAKLDKNIQMEKVLHWTDENFNAFKESIERLLPLIRFLNISSVDFYHKAKSFARTLPGTLCEDLLRHYLVPGSKNENTRFEDQPRNDYNLIFRGSRDGFTPKDFHRLCDKKGATVTIIKVKETGQLIGGYNLEPWHSQNQQLDGKRSFIFLLEIAKLKDAKLSKLVSGYGPFGVSHFGPYFGDGSIRLISNDLKIVQDAFVERKVFMSML